MALVVDDALFDPETTADLLKLSRILEYCDSTALGSFALRRSPSVRNSYVQALSNLDRVGMVFDERLYADSVLMTSPKKDKATYEELLRKAKAIGVPEPYTPPFDLKPPCRSVAHSASGTLNGQDEASGLSTPATLPGVKRPAMSPTDERPHTSPGPSPRATTRTRPSLSFSTSERVFKSIVALVPSPTSSPRSPTAGSSVSSFFSGASQDSAASAKRHHARRDSLMQYFRRDHYRRGSNATVSSPRSFSRASRTSKGVEVESVDSAETLGHCSAQSSSVQSPPRSIRSSTSSSIDVYQSFSFRERRALEQPLKSQRFLEMQQRCQGQAQRFTSFSEHQRAALPLLFGRNRLYMAERREVDVKKLQQQHDAAMEELENRHLEQEIAETEKLRVEREEMASKNATALKYVNRRISMLGNEVTAEHLRRLEEEANAMENLEQCHKRQIDTLIRTQKRERLNLQREQEREVAELRKQMKKEFDAASRSKREELESNLIKLEETIHERKSRLVARWYLELQVFKQESYELRDSFIGPLPMRILGLPRDFEETDNRTILRDGGTA